MMGLTPRSRECLELIRAHVKAHGIAPTHRELKERLGMASDSSVQRIIDILVSRGVVVRRCRRRRGIQLVQTEDFHLPNCLCDACRAARYLAQLKIVQGIQVPAPAALQGKLVGLRALSNVDRLHWRAGFPKKQAAPRTRTALPSGGC